MKRGRFFISQEIKKMQVSYVLRIPENIYNTKKTIIVNFANCTSNTIPEKDRKFYNLFDYADVYTNRINNDVAGTCTIFGDGKIQRKIAVIFSAYNAGCENSIETENLRLNWIKSGLKHLEKLCLELQKKTGVDVSLAFLDNLSENIMNEVEKLAKKIKVYVIQDIT